MAAALSLAERASIEGAIEVLRKLLAPELPDEPPSPNAPPMAWGARVSAEFRDRVRWIAADLAIGTGVADGANKLMAWMAFESGRSFSPSVRNMAGSGATGLIQFMPKTAIALGTSVDALARMTAEDQLNFVWKYLEPWDNQLRTLADGYMSILWPAAVGIGEDEPLWSRTGRPTHYRQNSGLDANSDGTITKGEAAAKVAALLTEGLRPENLA